MSSPPAPVAPVACKAAPETLQSPHIDPFLRSNRFHKLIREYSAQPYFIIIGMNELHDPVARIRATGRFELMIFAKQTPLWNTMLS